ncbi:MAG: hypothetical protein AB7I18_07930 [Candidatus Berkiella sp.]
MGNKPADIETTTLLEALASPNSYLTTANPGLTGSLENAEILRQALLNTFKNVNRIHAASQNQTLPNIISKKIVSLFKNEPQGSTAKNAQQMQEALAFMHRELTNLITASKDQGDRFRIEDAEKNFEIKIKDIIAKGMKSMPKGALKSPLREQMEGIKAIIEGCTTTLKQKQTPKR